MLRSYARFTAARGDESIRAATTIEWASQAPSPERPCVKLRVVRAFAVALHAEDKRHELPPRNIFGKRRRRSPHLLATERIRHLLVRSLALARTEMAQTQFGTIRTQLLKVAAQVQVSVRRIRVSLSSLFPRQALFAHCMSRLREAETARSAPAPCTGPPS